MRNQSVFVLPLKLELPIVMRPASPRFIVGRYYFIDENVKRIFTIGCVI